MTLKWETVARNSAGPVDAASLDDEQGLVARVMSHGATLLSVLAPDRNGRQHDVTLGFDDPAAYFGVHPYFGAVIGRFANRIAGARFTLDGHEHRLSANEGRNHLHGGTRGFDKVSWTRCGERAGDSPQVSWQHVSPAGEEGYPGLLVVRAHYSVCAGTLRLDYEATSDAPTPINLTHHAYWNLLGRGDVLGHRLQLLGSHFLPVDEELIPTGERRPVAGTPMDFMNPALIGARLDSSDVQLAAAKGGYDHCWALDRLTPGLQLAARLTEPTSGRVMEVSTTEPGVQFYSGNQLDGSVRGKGGHAYEKYGGLCLETQHFPDGPHHPEFPSTVLRPGQTYRQSTTYRFFVEDDASG